MALFPEHGPSTSGVVKEIPDEIDELPGFPEGEIKKVETAFKANVQDGKKQLIQTPANQVVSITIPGTQKSLTAWSKGPAENSITWLARFWLRMIKKAVFFGWRVVLGGKNASV